MQSLLASVPEENGTPALSGTALAAQHKVCSVVVPFREDITHFFHAYCVYRNAIETMNPFMTSGNG